MGVWSGGVSRLWSGGGVGVSRLQSGCVELRVRSGVVEWGVSRLWSGCGVKDVEWGCRVGVSRLWSGGGVGVSRLQSGCVELRVRSGVVEWGRGLSYTVFLVEGHC